MIAEIKNRDIVDYLPSERELASRYNTSRINVKQATQALLNHKLILKVLPRKFVVTSETKLTRKIVFISFLRCDWTKMQSRYFTETIRGVLDGIPSDYTCQYFGVDLDKEAEILQELIEHPVDGLIAIPHTIGHYLVNVDLYSKLERLGCKIVFLLRDIREVISSSVMPDTMCIIRHAVNLLRENGCGHIVMLERDNSWMSDFRRDLLMFEYYQDPRCHFVTTANMACNPVNNYQDVTHELSGKITALNLPKRERVGIISLCGDQWILPLWDVLHDQCGIDFKVFADGQIRDTLVDDLKAKSITEDIFVNTPINYNSEQIGGAGVKHLISLIESNANYHRTILIQPVLTSKGEH
jgi:DNA-binding LacI/PurR family transcriptional regulator